MKQIFFAILMIASFQLAQGQDATSGHSLFSMMPNYSVDKYSVINKDFDQLKYLVPDAKNSAGYAEVLKEGAFEECRFAFNGTMQNAPSNLQILQNFKNAVTQKGGQVVFEDKFYKDKVYLKLKKGGDTYWIKVYADGIGNYTISSIRETAMKQDVVLNAGEITRDEDETIRGNRPKDVPRHMANLWLDKTIETGGAEGLGFGAGLRYVGDRYGDNTNTLKIPGYVLIDAAVHYDYKDWRFALNATNLFDKKYVGTLGQNGFAFTDPNRTLQSMLVGAPRQAFISLRKRF